MTTPAYYLRGGEEYQPRVIAKRLGMTFDEGNLLKYLMRAGHKPGVSRLEDLEKLLDLAQKMVDDERAETAETDETAKPFVGVHCPATGGECKGRCVGSTCKRLEKATVVSLSGSEGTGFLATIGGVPRASGWTIEVLCERLSYSFKEGWVGTHDGRRYGGGMIDGEIYLTPVLDVRDR